MLLLTQNCAEPTVDERDAAAPPASRIAARPDAATFVRSRRSWRSWTVPPRFQLFEFCDQGWLKGAWREAYFDGLNLLFRIGGAYRHMYEPFRRWAFRSRSARVLDLASGGAGPIETMLNAAARSGKPFPHVTLSDLHPDLDALRRVQARFPNQVDFLSEPLDAAGERCAAMDVPMRSISAGFHHFPPGQAREILRASVARAEGLFIMEPMERTWLSLLFPIPCFILLLLAPFFARRFSARKFAVTTLIPLVPLMIVFDGIVSVLRMYRREELWALLPAGAQSTWEWEWGMNRYRGIIRATYFCGWRRQKEDDRTSAAAEDCPLEAGEAAVHAARRRPWEVARWGRLLAGAGTLLFTALGLAVNPLWHIGTLLGALNLVVTAVTDHCVLRDTLLRLGAKEREDLFLPGGAVRHEVSARRQPLSGKEVAGWVK